MRKMAVAEKIAKFWKSISIKIILGSRKMIFFRCRKPRFLAIAIEIKTELTSSRRDITSVFRLISTGGSVSKQITIVVIVKL